MLKTSRLPFTIIRTGRMVDAPRVHDLTIVTKCDGFGVLAYVAILAAAICGAYLGYFL